MAGEAKKGGPTVRLLREFSHAQKQIRKKKRERNASLGSRKSGRSREGKKSWKNDAACRKGGKILRMDFPYHLRCAKGRDGAIPRSC